MVIYLSQNWYLKLIAQPSVLQIYAFQLNFLTLLSTTAISIYCLILINKYQFQDAVFSLPSIQRHFEALISVIKV